MTIRKVISGGQTGADRGGLECAAELGLERGGWAPKGWRSEDGVIPEWYRTGMQECWSTSYRVRTGLNIEAAHGTLILSFGLLAADSGSYLTANIARRRGRPNLHVVLPEDGELGQVGRERVTAWLKDHRIEILNVAGPRESREVGIQTAARRALVLILGEGNK